MQTQSPSSTVWSYKVRAKGILQLQKCDREAGSATCMPAQVSHDAPEMRG